MFIEYYEIFSAVVLLIFWVAIICLIIFRAKSGALKSVSEFSFQKYAKFYGKTVLHDEKFNIKINKIYELIIKNKETDIKKIAQLSNCEYDECILKIKYLKNKREIGDYYIDYEKGLIKQCTREDSLLIEKYAPYIYMNHYQIDEIARRLPNSTLNNLEKIKDQVLKELDYLDRKSLVNGLNIDKVDKKIIYYSVEKKNKERDYISINCKNCGALNDIPRNGKARCEYCKTIIEDGIKK